MVDLLLFRFSLIFTYPWWSFSWSYLRYYLLTSYHHLLCLWGRLDDSAMTIATPFHSVLCISHIFFLKIYYIIKHYIFILHALPGTGTGLSYRWTSLVEVNQTKIGLCRLDIEELSKLEVPCEFFRNKHFLQWRRMVPWTPSVTARCGCASFSWNTKYWRRWGQTNLRET